MTRQIVVNVGHRETRVAMVEDGRLAELKIERERDVLGNVYMGRVENVVSGLDAAFVECGLDRNVFLHVSDAVLEEPTRKMLRRKMDSFPPIAEVVQPGQTFLMQVTKGSVGSKGPRATRRVSLPGRYLVLMVQGGNKVGVSRKILDEAERDRLRDLGEKVKPEGMGIIIRTRAEGVGRVELQRDITFLTRVWSSIQRRAKRTLGPALIHEDLSLVFEIIRDVFSADVERFVVDDAEVFEKVKTLVGQIAPELKGRVERYEGAKPIFAEFDLEKQLERALRPRVWLPQGGHINVEQTEALTVVDVNSGKFTGARSLTDTVLRTNLAAVTEVVNQIRLRDVGGIIVVDFIDMDNPHHRRDVMGKLKDELKKDRVRTRVAHLTPLGLVEMTRKRTGDTLNVQMQSTCPFCEGRGRIASFETTAIRIDDRLRELAAKDGAKDIRVTCSPGVALQLIGIDGAEMKLLEDDLGRRIHVRCSTTIHPERFVINTGPPEGLKEGGLPFAAGDVIAIEPSQALDMPSEGLMACVEGCLVHVADAPHSLDHPRDVRLTEVTRSYIGAVVASGKPHRRAAARPAVEPALEDVAGLELMGEPVTVEPESEPEPVAATTEHKRRRRPRGGRRHRAKGVAEQVMVPPVEGSAPAIETEEPTSVVEARSVAPPEEQAAEPAAPPAKRPGRRSYGRRKVAAPKEAPAEETLSAPDVEETSAAPPEERSVEPAAGPAKRPRRRSHGRRRTATPAGATEAPAEEPAAAGALAEQPASEPVAPKRKVADIPLFVRPAPEPSGEAVPSPSEEPVPRPMSRWRRPSTRRKAAPKTEEAASPEAPKAEAPAPEPPAPVAAEAPEAAAPKRRTSRRPRVAKKATEETPPAESE